ncbi:MAG: uracil-DNA glycosylase [candidate division NC10 bacterium]
MASLRTLREQVIACRRCPRLVAHREAVAQEPPKRFQGQGYWARPLPGFGDPKARLLIVGLAPAAHGGNRTGRLFTGDASGEWLMEALHAARFANQPTSTHARDGLRLRGAWITAPVRCAPPANRPTPQELEACLPFLVRELELLPEVRVVVALGKFGFDAYLRAREIAGRPVPKPRPRFRHGGVTRFPDGVRLLASYHPSQQNTFTGKLTRGMLHTIFRRARALLDR